MKKMNKKLGEIFKELFMSVEQDSLLRIKEGSKKEEDHITSDIFTRLEERINGKNFNGLQVQTKQFSGRGPNSDESITGADGALFLDVSYLKLRKFYIFQAKNFSSIENKFDKRAIQQKRKMLLYTSDSFFLIYTPERFYWVSAAIVELEDKLADLPHKEFSEFQGDFFNCFIGDHSPSCPFRFPKHFYRDICRNLEEFNKFSDKITLAKQNLFIQVSKEN